MQRKIVFLFSVIALLMLYSCGGSKQEKTKSHDEPSIAIVDAPTCDTQNLPNQIPAVDVTADKMPEVSVYLFHSARRCATCIAIEDCVNEVLDELNENSVFTFVSLVEINADDEKNEAICEKYEAFGTALFVTRTFKGKESITDMTAQAFKLASNKPDEFKKLLRDQIQKDLK